MQSKTDTLAERVTIHVLIWPIILLLILGGLWLVRDTFRTLWNAHATTAVVTSRTFSPTSGRTILYSFHDSAGVEKMGEAFIVKYDPQTPSVGDTITIHYFDTGRSVYLTFVDDFLMPLFLVFSGVYVLIVMIKKYRYGN